MVRASQVTYNLTQPSRQAGRHRSEWAVATTEGALLRCTAQARTQRQATPNGLNLVEQRVSWHRTEVPGLRLCRLCQIPRTFATSAKVPLLFVFERRHVRCKPV